MSVRDELNAELAKVRSAFRNEMMGRMVGTPKAMRLQLRIAAIEDELAALDCEEANRLALAKAPLDEVLEIIAIPLLADVLNDVITGVNGMLRAHGCADTVFADYARQIRSLALKMVDSLPHGESHLPDLLTVDDTLVDAVRKKIMSFIRQRLNITK